MYAINILIDEIKMISGFMYHVSGKMKNLS